MKSSNLGLTSSISDAKQLQLEQDLDAIANKVRILQQQMVVLHQRQREQDKLLSTAIGEIRVALERHVADEVAWRIQQDKTMDAISSTLNTIKVNIVGDAVANVNRWQMSYKFTAVIALIVVMLYAAWKHDGNIITSTLGWLR